MMVVSNGRPESVTSLVIDGEFHNSWCIDNRNSNRFYLVNVRFVMEKIDIDETRYQPFFDKAEITIEQQTRWREDHPFHYTAHHTQINNRLHSKAKRFGTAVTAIVALELAAEAKKRPINVYDHLRILPAHFFVDLFDVVMLNSIDKYYVAMSVADKKSVFDSDGTESFEDLFLRKIGQRGRTGLLKQLAQGCCATKSTCEQIVKFVNSTFATRSEKFLLAQLW